MPTSSPGIFVTFEGGEGSGKSTQLHLLAGYLRALGHAVTETRDPGGTFIGTRIRAALLDPRNTAMDATAELLLYEASRAQLVAEVIRPALDAGHVVLCDRFSDSTTAYQGYGRRLDLQTIHTLNTLATGDTRPVLTFFLAVGLITGLARAAARRNHDGPRVDRIEAETLAFHERVREGYHILVAAEHDRFHVIDAHQTPELVQAEIRRRLITRLRAMMPMSPPSMTIMVPMANDSSSAHFPR